MRLGHQISKKRGQAFERASERIWRHGKDFVKLHRWTNVTQTKGNGTSDSEYIGVACADLSCSARVTIWGWAGSCSVICCRFLRGFNLRIQILVQASKSFVSFISKAVEVIFSIGLLRGAGGITSITAIIGVSGQFRLVRFFGQLVSRLPRLGLRGRGCSVGVDGRGCVVMMWRWDPSVQGSVVRARSIGDWLYA
jgi:hypothetical protein